jgi:hypothetical protein
LPKQYEKEAKTGKIQAIPGAFRPGTDGNEMNISNA